MMQVTRSEKHVVNQSSKWFSMLDDFCFRAKNLYNHTNYLIRQEYTKNGNWLRYESLDKMLREDKEYPDYDNMPYSGCAQQTLRYLDTAWSSFFAAVKDWRIHPSKYLGRPRPPKYLNKTKGRSIIYLTSQAIRLRDNVIKFPKTFRGFEIKPYCVELDNFVKLQQCRIVPKGNHIDIEVVYTIDVPDIRYDNQRYLGLDLGIDNLAAVGNNVGLPFYLIDGKGLKSINKYYNKLVAKNHSYAKEINGQYSSKKLLSIHQKRNNKMNDYLHKASRWVVEFAKENNIGTIVIGKNDLWKQEVKLGKKTNQSFVQIPHARFITMVQYKAEEYGIRVDLQEEAYTSGTSFLDDEFPCKECYNKSRRFFRGLFRTNQGIIVNSDANASLQIMKKSILKDEDIDEIPFFTEEKQILNSLRTPIRIKVS